MTDHERNDRGAAVEGIAADELTGDDREARLGGLSEELETHDVRILEGMSITEIGFRTFLRELPDLLAKKSNYKKLVAYHGEKRVAIASSRKRLFKKCHALNLPFDELMFECIAPFPLPS